MPFNTTVMLVALETATVPTVTPGVPITATVVVPLKDVFVPVIVNN
jgi:hypothetical protein